MGRRLGLGGEVKCQKVSSFSRTACLDRFASEPTLAHLVPMLRAELGPDAPLVTGDSFLSGEFPHEPGSPGTSSCGAQQGSPIAAACFAVVTRDIFMAADSHLCSVESPLGAARFSHDDGFLCSPDPGRVHTSFATLCSALHSINLEVQVAKCKAVFPPGVDPPAGIPSCPGLILHGIPAMTCRRRLRHPSPLPCSNVSSWRLRSRVVLAYWLSGRMRRKLEYSKMNHLQPLQSTSPVMHEVPFQLLACVQ